jgi:hypothetical protein
VVNVDGITETEPEGLYRGEEAEQPVFEGKRNDKSDDADDRIRFTEISDFAASV